MKNLVCNTVKFYLLIITMLPLNTFSVRGQCLVTSLNISTGFQPGTGFVAPGIDASPAFVAAVVDPMWTYGGASASMAASITAGLPPGPYPAGAYVVQTDPGWVTCGAARWINCSPNYLNTSALGIYNMTFERKFRLCCDADVTFNYTIAADDDINDIHVVGHPPFLSGMPMTYLGCTTGTYTVHLTAGTHTLSATIGCDVIDKPNGNGLNVSCTISTPTAALISETTSCADYGCPTIQAITGKATMCVGECTTFTDATVGGTWSSSNTSVATVGSASGIVCGISDGSATITYHIGCLSQTYTVTVYSTATIVPTGLICQGDVITLSAMPTGGTWSGGSPGTATVTSSGILNCTGSGTVVVTYTPLACSPVSVTLTINASPYITGTLEICQNNTTTLSGTPIVGLWSSSNPAVGTVGSVNGQVYGISPGVTYITYTVPTGCYTTRAVTVNVVPWFNDSYPTATICQNEWAGFNAAPPGGVWMSGSTAIAVPGSYGFHGMSPGTTLVSYILPTGCFITGTLNVLPLPAPITGPSSVCVHETITLSDATTGGTWISDVGSYMPGTACYCVWNGTTNIPSTYPGEVTGVAAGVANITYVGPNGCRIATPLTVNPLPAPITGSLSVCLGDITTLSSSMPGSGLWSSSNTTVGSIGTLLGEFTSLSLGTTTISFTYITTGCFITAVETVNPLPDPVTAPQFVCAGSTMTLTNTPAGGTWSTTDVTYATVDATTGVVTGLSPGAPIFTYTLPTGCYVTFAVTVVTLPVLDPIVGPDVICSGSTGLFTNSFTDGYWDLSNAVIATIETFTGNLTAISDGVTTVGYNYVNICGRTSVTKDVLIGPPILSRIAGPTYICQGHTATMTDMIPGGTWSAAPSTVVTVNPTTGAITGINTGTATITYTVTNICGTTSITTNVTVADMNPYITAGFSGACPVVADPPYLTTSSPCIYTCANASMTYYAHVPPGSTFTWSIIGGTVVADMGDSIIVNWITPGGSGSVNIHVVLGDCTADATLCVRVKESPAPYFSASTTSICLNGSISFTDGSTWSDPESPVTTWIWDFGDGGTSGLPNPVHTYTAAGTYLAFLTVKNPCGCKASYGAWITVNPLAGPDIQCPSIVCEKDSATYTTNEPCGTYNWIVNGGTIVNGAGTPTVTVVWDHADASGYGSVKLFTPCAPCPETTTIKVPIILDNATIEGPSVVCVGTQYRYEVPLWAATRYHWQALSSLGAGGIVGAGGFDDHYVTVNFTTPGTYRVRCTYQNDLGLCGGDVFKTVTVKPRVTISGSTELCFGGAQTYTLSGGTVGSWELFNSAGVLQSASVGDVNSYTAYPYPAGNFVLKATGDFCSDPVNIHIAPWIGIVDTIWGPDTVCLSHTYTYKARTPMPGTTFEWSITGGTLSATTGNEVTVVWNATGYKTISAHRKSLASPYCIGDDYVKQIEAEDYAASLSGPTIACANSYGHYSNAYTRADYYDWRILPSTSGSIIAGNHASATTIQWNNVPGGTSAAVIIDVTKCDTTVSDTIWASFVVSPLVVAAPDSVCPHTTIFLMASPGDSAYVWNFGDGTTPVITSVNTVSHQYQGTENILRHVQVTPILGAPHTYGCQPSGMASADIFVRRAPHSLLADTPAAPCPNTELTVHFVMGDTCVSLNWYHDGSIIPGATSLVYTATDTGKYWIVAIGENGCAGTGYLNYVLCETSTVVPTCTVAVTTATYTVSCNRVDFIGVAPSGAYGVGWSWLGATPATQSGFMPYTYSPTATATYTVPGTYTHQFGAYLGGCISTNTISVTIPIVPEFAYHFSCGTSGTYNVDLEDQTALLPGYTVTGRLWSDGTTPIGGGAGATALTITRAPGTPCTITETVYYTSVAGPGTCTITHNFTTPLLPVASFSVTATSICEGIPISFTPAIAPGVVSYYWDFGDASSSLLTFPQRTYTWGGSGNPTFLTPMLIVADIYGCTSTYSTPAPFQIFHNVVAGNVLPNDPNICSDALPVTLLFSPTGTLSYPLSYNWQMEATAGTLGTNNSLIVSAPGYYRILVKDVHECQNLLPLSSSDHVKVVPMPPSYFSGRSQYCAGESIDFYATEWPGATYAWTRNGAPLGTTTPHLTDVMPVGGPYDYQLTTTVTDGATTCTQTSPVVHASVQNIPATPAVAGPVAIDCDNYHLQLTANAPEPGTLTWSNGVSGAVNDIYEGGLFQVLFTSLGGCTSTNTVSAPMSLQHYMQYFPSGCYTLCHERLPLTLAGATGYFNQWQWLHNGAPALSGSGYMPGYGISGGGSYQWLLDNSLCNITSAPLNITDVSCGPCSLGLQAKLDCSNTLFPNTYYISISFNNPSPGSSYTLGTNLGPIMPSLGITGPYPMEMLNLGFTTFDPLAGTVTVQLEYTDPSGNTCYEKVTVTEPYPCPWPVMKPGAAAADTAVTPRQQLPGSQLTTSMLVFPNPAVNQVTVSYNYGRGQYQSRILSVFNAVGIKVAQAVADEAAGTWKMNVNKWAPGVYTIRMEGDGAALQTQRVVVMPE